MKKINVRMITVCALMIAFSVVLTRFASFRFSFGGIENFRLGIGTLPIMLAGILFGPIVGGLVGIASDLLGMLVSPMGPFMVHFTFVSMLYGFIPPLFCFPFQYANYKAQLTYRMRVYLGILLGQVIPQMLFIPYFQLTLFKIPYSVSLTPKFFTVPIQFLAISLLISVLIKPLIEIKSGK